jgi:hypothetical protein
MSKQKIEAALDKDFADMFLQGQIDCREGREAKKDMPDGYNRGFGCEYEVEQINTEMMLRAGQ